MTYGKPVLLIIELGRCKVGVFNIYGTIFMDNVSTVIPFKTMEELMGSIHVTSESLTSMGSNK